MRKSKGYTDELEKINRNDSSIALTISWKEAAAKKLRFRMSFKKFNIEKPGDLYKKKQKKR